MSLEVRSALVAASIESCDADPVPIPPFASLEFCHIAPTDAASRFHSSLVIALLHRNQVFDHAERIHFTGRDRHYISKTKYFPKLIPLQPLEAFGCYVGFWASHQSYVA